MIDNLVGLTHREGVDGFLDLYRQLNGLHRVMVDKAIFYCGTEHCCQALDRRALHARHRPFGIGHHLAQHCHVYLVSLTGESMQGVGIYEGDLAIVDRSIESALGHIVIALLNNEPVCKRLCIRGREVILMSENPKYPPRYVLEGDELAIWGVITSSVRSHV